jgi:hypothetical protein
MDARIEQRATEALRIADRRLMQLDDDGGTDLWHSSTTVSP